MTPGHLNLRALSASDTIRRFAAVVPSLWPDTKVHWGIHTNVGHFDATSDPNSEVTAKALAEVLKWTDGREYALCSRIDLRRERDPKEQIVYATTDGLRATVEIKNASGARIAEIAAALEAQFDFIGIADVVKQIDLSSPEATALALREASVTDLHAQLSKLGSLLSTVTERDVELRQRRVAELDAEYQARVSAFEAERAKTLEEDEQKRQAMQAQLNQQESELRQRISEFDARESKFVRRDLLAKLTELLDQFGTFSLSEDTTKKRRPVTIAVFVMAAAFIALALGAGWNYFATLDLHYLPASTAGLLGFSATMLFYLKWSDRWFREHADEELQSKRYKADMLRASWAAELAAEWAKEGKDVPPELLEVFARNLFVNAPLGETEHPADALLGLLKRTQKLDVTKDKVTLEAGGTEPK